ncbi:MAG: hypothetical protein CFE26_02370 [Verrucomicrobiales bacterium VVV1]|nr:MAG: hypothetical protein CFE26_02370 [Verrucomicrobiales bacterium VVV1]
MIPVFFSCEHATCAVPEPWRELFRGHEEAVASAEGWEPGALNLAQGFAIKFRTPLAHGDVTRLLIDLEATDDAKWSRFSSTLTDVQRSKLMDRHERPFREAVRSKVAEALRRGPLAVQVLVHAVAPEEGAVVIEVIEGDEFAGKLAAEWCRALGQGADKVKASVQRVPEVSAVGMSLRQTYDPSKLAVMVLRVSSTYFLEGRPVRWEKAKKRLIDSLTEAVEVFSRAPESSSSPEA